MKSPAMMLLVALSACGPIVQIGGNATPPSSLLTLRAVPGEAARSDGRLLLLTLPGIPGALRTVRIPVTTQATEIAYLADANWVEQPNILFQRLLGEVIQARSGRPVVDERNVDVAAEHRLSGRLVEFGLDVRAAPQVSVRYDAVLTSAKDGYIASRRFEAVRPVTSERGPDVARALNDAANALAGEVGDWIAAST